MSYSMFYDLLHIIGSYLFLVIKIALSQQPFRTTNTFVWLFPKILYFIRDTLQLIWYLATMVSIFPLTVHCITLLV